MSNLSDGELAQLARAPALHAGGQEFESPILHQYEIKSLVIQGFFFIYKVFVSFYTSFVRLILYKKTRLLYKNKTKNMT